MSDFERELPSVRLAQTLYGDDLQAVAARELGDANRWAELVWINRLSPPYITDDPLLVSASVLLSGSYIQVPAPVGVPNGSGQSGQVFERDCLMRNKVLVEDAGGDIAVVTGADNLRQQLKHRVSTPRGQARRNPDYGCLLWRLLGKVNGPAAGMLGAEYVKSALKADYRVSEVVYSKATVSGDVVSVTAKAKSIDGAVVDIALTE